MHPHFSAALSSERFLQEIAILSRLTHPQILPLHDSGGGDDLLWFITPFIDGGSLRDRLGCDRCVPIAEAIRLVGEIADALDYAHARGFIHRDLKPENILLAGKRPLVADFGIAHAGEETRAPRGARRDARNARLHEPGADAR